MKLMLLAGFGVILAVAFLVLVAIHNTSSQDIPWVRLANIPKNSQFNSLSWSEMQGVLYVQATTTTQAGGSRTLSEPVPQMEFGSALVAPNRGDPSFVFIKDSKAVYLIYVEGDAGGDDISTQLILGADPSTFRIISYEYENRFFSTYAADKSHVYGCDPSDLRGCVISPIPGADPSTFRVVSGAGFDAQDKHRKYNAGGAI